MSDIRYHIDSNVSTMLPCGLSVCFHFHSILLDVILNIQCTHYHICNMQNWYHNINILKRYFSTIYIYIYIVCVHLHRWIISAIYQSLIFHCLIQRGHPSFYGIFQTIKVFNNWQLSTIVVERVWDGVEPGPTPNILLGHSEDSAKYG